MLKEYLVRLVIATNYNGTVRYLLICLGFNGKILFLRNILNITIISLLNYSWNLKKFRECATVQRDFISNTNVYRMVAYTSSYHLDKSRYIARHITRTNGKEMRSACWSTIYWLLANRLIAWAPGLTFYVLRVFLFKIFNQ